MKHPKPHRRIKSWLFPGKENLNVKWRSALGLIANLALASYVVPRRALVFDQLSHGSPTSLVWTYVMAVAPCAMLLLLLPVIISRNLFYRWLAIGLCFFPAYLVVATWVQLLAPLN